MSKRDQAIIVLHGAIVLMVGNLYGFPLGSAIESGSSNVRAWSAAHPYTPQPKSPTAINGRGREGAVRRYRPVTWAESTPRSAVW